jgi:lambda repressor-like predicted transcriptional regulator
MHPADIKAAIQKAGSTQAAIARQLGVTKVQVRRAVYAIDRSRRVEAAISRVTGISTRRLWPKWYQQGGRQ